MPETVLSGRQRSLTRRLASRGAFLGAKGSQSGAQPDEQNIIGSGDEVPRSTAANARSRIAQAGRSQHGL